MLRPVCVRDGALTMFLLSSAKVSLTNMGPRAKPKLFSVSLTQNFQRGRQVWEDKWEGWFGPVLLLPNPCPSGARTSFQNFRETFLNPAEILLGTGPRGPATPLCTTMSYFLNAGSTRGVPSTHQSEPWRQGGWPFSGEETNSAQRSHLSSSGSHSNQNSAVSNPTPHSPTPTLSCFLVEAKNPGDKGPWEITLSNPEQQENLSRKPGSQPHLKPPRLKTATAGPDTFICFWCHL